MIMIFVQLVIFCLLLFIVLWISLDLLEGKKFRINSTMLLLWVLFGGLILAIGILEGVWLGAAKVWGVAKRDVISPPTSDGN